MQIIPMRDLKNTVEVERRCAEEIEYYERTMQKMYEAKTIIEGLEDVKAGRTVDGEKAISDIRRKYGI